MKTIEEFIGGYIDAHEGGLSLDPDDNGNWTGMKKCKGSLVGSKFGVTSAALAGYRGVPVSSITRQDISNLSRKEAIDIGVALYYHKPKFDRLLFNRVTLSVIDKGWGSGPVWGIKLLQRMIGVPDDGKIGPQTIKTYEKFLSSVGEEEAARRFADRRIAFDTSLNQRKYINGWNNRTRSFLPGTKWWSEWGA